MATTGTKPFEIVRMCDPAIAITPPENFSDYMTSRDFAKLLLTDDVKPMVFWGRPLSMPERREVANKTSVRDQYEAAFVRGLLRVTECVREDGSTFEWIRPDDRSGKPKLVPDADLEAYFDEATVQEIGMVIMRRSFLGRTNGHWYPLPDISRDALSAHWLRRAAQTRDSLALAESRRRQGEQLEALHRSSLAGDGSTDATATEPPTSPPT